MSETKIKFDSIESALEDLKNGVPVVVVNNPFTGNVTSLGVISRH